MSNKSKFLDAVVKGGIKETKHKLKSGAMNRDEPVDLEKELRDAKAQINGNLQVVQLGVTDDDLRDVIKRVAAHHKLTVKLSDGSVVDPTPGERMSLMDRATATVLEHTTPSPKGVLYDSVKSIMRMQAQKDIKDGAVVVPVDVVGYATKVMNGAKRIPGLKLTLEDYTEIIRDICEEFSLEMKEVEDGQ